jgi:hypothetical protein
MALDKSAVEKEISRLSELIDKLDLAKAMEDNDDVRRALASCVGQIRAAKTWLIKIYKGLDG